MMQKNKHRNKIILCSSLFLLGSLSKAEEFKIKDSSLFIPHRLGKISLSHDENGFHVLQNSKRHDIKNYWVDKLLRNIQKKHLEAFLNNGYISLNQMDNGEFSLKANARGLGGGPVSGFIAYWTTKAVGYGAIPAVVGVNATLAHRTATKAGLGRGTSLALATGTTLATTVTIVNPGTIIAVESAATSVGAFFALLPFLP